MEDYPDSVNLNYSNQPVQVTVQGNEREWSLNITCRGEIPDNVAKACAETFMSLVSQVAFTGMFKVVMASIKPTGEKCLKCGSDMSLKTKNKKDGSTYDILECTNNSCNTNEYNGKFYRTTRFPPKK